MRTFAHTIYDFYFCMLTPVRIVAIRVFQYLGDASMVNALAPLLGVEEESVLAGHISTLFDGAV